LRVGVLAFQGDFAAHLAALERCGVEAVPVKYEEELRSCRGLIIPGGESTTIGKLMGRANLDQPLREFAAQGHPIFGTCAGLILLAKDIVGSDQYRLGLMNLTVARNAYGRQTESFECKLVSPLFGEPSLPGIFIRAPQITTVGPEVEALVFHDDRIVLCRQGKLLGGTFHPELTPDLRVHQYFLGLIA
jgi:pyridoxal 5'-phosphate synthase pdxT subunit